jgi:hypothetical protein
MGFKFPSEKQQYSGIVHPELSVSRLFSQEPDMEWGNW